MDPVLLTAVLSLLGFSMVMVFSAVAGIDSDSRGGLSLLSKHVFSTALGVAIVLITARLNLSLWQRWNRPLLFVGIVLLVLVLIPGIGQKVNGSFRWIALGPLRFQPSELIKVFVIVSLADYCCRSSVDIRNFRAGIVLPSVVLGVIALLLLREPDYGCTAVVLATAYSMIFLAGTDFSARSAVGIGTPTIVFVQPSIEHARELSFHSKSIEGNKRGRQKARERSADGKRLA
jgi:cell division protein FtsW